MAECEPDGNDLQVNQQEMNDGYLADNEEQFKESKNTIKYIVMMLMISL